MDLDVLNQRGIVLVGAGRMGSAMLEGWLARGLQPDAVHVIDPNPSPALIERGIRFNGALPDDPAVVVIAVKPQMMADALPQLKGFGNGDTLILTVAAGVTIAAYERAFGASTPIVRIMPNTPAAIGQGISAIIGNAAAGPADLALAESLMSAVGQVVRLDDESQMDAVTALSGSGPAYVFHLIETMAAGGEAQGLSPELALQLARATVAGAGQLALVGDLPPGKLRENVTSPGGTTAAALKILMDGETGFPPLLRRAIAAAADRGRELGA
ncbi:pyrroline-5-carboxylate reductase [Paracoccus pacificus]|uniref:Pyrroline-5-carboxylate reductase n=1 Tax=Paracoccus pacificus TaxID=1463598 RepID=A0ABW4RB92_9RHOB